MITGEEYVYDEDYGIGAGGEVRIDAKHLYHLFVQPIQTPDGQQKVGFGFKRADNYVIPANDDVVINTNQIATKYQIKPGAPIVGVFEQAKTKESAEAAGIVQPPAGLQIVK
jgi:hypothetical protein